MVIYSEVLCNSAARKASRLNDLRCVCGQGFPAGPHNVQPQERPRPQRLEIAPTIKYLENYSP